MWIADGRMSAITDFPRAAITEFPRCWPVGSFYMVLVLDWGAARPGRLLGR
jgi:hypothetical protein